MANLYLAVNFPNLNFEINIIKSFLDSESKFNWLIQQFRMDYNTDVQLAIIFMIGFTIFSLFILYDAERYSDYLPGKPKRLIIRILFFPLITVFGYYFAKIILYWFLWLTTLGWWFIPALLVSALIFIFVILLISKLIDK